MSSSSDTTEQAPNYQDLPLVSIVTPAYNQAEYLAETIDSVLAQDYPNIEYIVLDDGSTDATSEILAKYNGRIRWERHENMGQAKTLNRGWTMSRGTLLGYLSSDDRLVPTAVSQLVATLQRESSVVVAYCDFELMDANGRCFRTVQTEDFSASRLKLDLVCQPGPGALFRRQIFEETGGWAGHLHQVPDFEFWLRASRCGDFVRVPQVLAHYRVHEGSASFRSISPQRSMEIVDVMTAYWGDQSDASAKRSLSTAHLISAKSHAQSGRYRAFLKSCSNTFRQNPSSAFQMISWRLITSGLLRRLIYRLRNSNR